MFRLKPVLRRHLTPLEQLVMEFVWAHSTATAEACREGVASQRALKESTMRTVLHNLEEKGYVTHTVKGRTYVYRPIETKRNAAVRATQQIIDRFCGGSAEELLIGLVDNHVLKPKQLQQLAAEIASKKLARTTEPGAADGIGSLPRSEGRTGPVRAAEKLARKEKKA